MRRSLSYALVILLAIPSAAHGQVGPLPVIAAIVFKDQIVNNILDQADTRAQSILFSGEQSANHVLSDAALELQVQSQNLRVALADDMDKRFDQISKDEENALLSLQDLIDAANSLSHTAVDIVDDANIDLNQTLNRFSLLKKAPFLVSRVTGMYQLYQNGGDYYYIIAGNGFGLSSFSQSVKIEAFMNNEPLDVMPTKNHETLITIKNRLLPFDDSRLRTQNVWIRLTLAPRVSFAKPQTAVFNLPIACLPKVGATIKFSALTADKTFSGLKTNVSSYEYPAQGNGNGGGVDFRQSVNYLETQHVKSIELCMADQEGCHYCVAPDGSGLGQNPSKTYEVDESLHQIRFKAACGGSVCQLKWCVTYDNLADSSAWHDVDAAKKVKFGDGFYFDLPPHTTDWKLEGTLYNGEQIDTCVKGACDSNRQVKLVQTTTIGDHDRIAFTLKPPIPAARGN